MTLPIRYRYFVPPSIASVPPDSYTMCNYLKPGIGPHLRVMAFEVALRLTADWFHRCSVIDFGCADGPFVPSLATHFDRVLAIDGFPGFARRCSNLVDACCLDNVDVLCSSELSLEEIRSKHTGTGYHLLFLLATLEHVGEQPDLWESRVRFIRDVFSLLDEDGLVVISVPVMTGLPFLLTQVMKLRPGCSPEGPISMAEMLRAVVLGDTADLERR